MSSSGCSLTLAAWSGDCSDRRRCAAYLPNIGCIIETTPIASGGC